MVVLIRKCIFSCLLIRKMKISISFGDVFDRICHRKRFSSRRVFVFVLFSNFQSSQLFVTFYISNKNATSIPKKIDPGSFLGHFGSFLPDEIRRWIVLTWIFIWALSNSEWKDSKEQILILKLDIRLRFSFFKFF